MSNATLKRVAKKVAEEYQLKRVILFGSLANDQATKDSDVDLLVELPIGASIFDLAGVQVRFEELIGKKVDIIPAPLSNDALIQISKEVVLYAQQ